MKVKYEFLDGTFHEIEVDESFDDVFLELDTLERNNNRKETRRHVSLNGMEYEGTAFTSLANTEAEALLDIDIKALYLAMKILSPEQQLLLNKIFVDGRSITEIAKAEGVSHVAIINRLNRIYQKIRKKL